MIIFCKKYFFSTILIFSFLLFPFYACRKSAAGYNPYLHSKPTIKQQKANKKAMEEGAKNYRKQMRKTRRRMFGGSPPPGRPGN